MLYTSFASKQPPAKEKRAKLLGMHVVLAVTHIALAMRVKVAPQFI